MESRKNICALLLVAAFLALSGCATLIHSNMQTVTFRSMPEGATVFINDKEIGQTPLEHKLERKESHLVKIKMNNYQPSDHMIKNRISWWFFGNVFFAPAAPAGFLIDLFDGAMYKLDQDTVYAELIPGETARESSEGSAGGAAKRNIAILDLKSMGIGNHVALLLTEKMRSEFFNTGTYNVMNRENMAKVMEEQAFQNSDNCDTPECFAQIGKILGVEKIITGSIGKLGGTYSLTLKQIDIESSKNEKIINLSEKCDEDHLFNMIQSASRQLISSLER